MTRLQGELLCILTKLMQCIGYYEGALKGTWGNDPEILAKIELKQSETGKIIDELQKKILQEVDQ